MLRVLHFLIVATYLVLPIAAVIRLTLSRRRRQADDPAAPRVSTLVVTLICGAVVAGSVCFVYGYALKGRVPVTQLLIATYFAMSLLLLLRCFDAGLQWCLRRAVGIKRAAADQNSRMPVRSTIVLALRAVILAAIGLPFVMAAAMTYRPKVIPRDNPQTQLGFPFERVEFTTSDNVKLIGWWIPAIDSPRSRRFEGAGKETVIICHGLAAGKSNQLILARRLVPGGFNVLAFDFRAHGESGGQVTGYGALEKQDVLAAIKWVRECRPQQSEKIFGVGASMGAVALLSAAADDSPEGKALHAIATYAAYDDLRLLVHDVTQFYFRQPMPPLLQRIGLPIASLHAGVNLADFAPKRTITEVWPTPVLFIHGQQDEIIPFERGQALFESATQPKSHLWLPRGTHNDIVDHPGAARVVEEFFKAAGPMPVI